MQGRCRTILIRVSDVVRPATHTRQAPICVLREQHSHCLHSRRLHKRLHHFHTVISIPNPSYILIEKAIRKDGDDRTSATRQVARWPSMPHAPARPSIIIIVVHSTTASPMIENSKNTHKWSDCSNKNSKTRPWGCLIRPLSNDWKIWVAPHYEQWWKWSHVLQLRTYTLLGTIATANLESVKVACKRLSKWMSR